MRHAFIVFSVGEGEKANENAEGYSWKSNQHGLTVDTALAYELVTPDGTVRNVTAKDTDLFWALKVRCPPS